MVGIYGRIHVKVCLLVTDYGKLLSSDDGTNSRLSKTIYKKVR